MATHVPATLALMKPDPVMDSDGRPILDATGKPSEFELELCQISIVGDQFTEFTGPAVVNGSEMSPHLRWPAEYAAWKRGEKHAGGTALEAWVDGSLTMRTIKDLNDLNIATVEDLAAVSDVYVTRIIYGRELRSRAVHWLAAHPKREELSAKLREQNEKLVRRAGGVGGKRCRAEEEAANGGTGAELAKGRRKREKGTFLQRIHAERAAKREVAINTLENFPDMLLKGFADRPGEEPAGGGGV